MARTITLELDDLDYEAVQRCIAKRQAFRCWPTGDDASDDPLGGGSNIAGLAIAEICRGWEEMLTT